MKDITLAFKIGWHLWGIILTLTWLMTVFDTNPVKILESLAEEEVEEEWTW